MKIYVLGSAAGGGFPQWNCNCKNCCGVRASQSQYKVRTQSSILIQGDSEECVLFNASPDILRQIQLQPAIQPNRSIRDSAIAGIVLMDGQVDHTTGLFMLREGNVPLQIWCTKAVRDDLEHGNPIFKVLGFFCGVNANLIGIDKSLFSIPKVLGIEFYAIPLKSKAAPYSPNRDSGTPGDNIGVVAINKSTGKRLFYAPGLAEIESHVWAEMIQADCVMVDGTFWTDDEMIQLGLSLKKGSDIGHLAQSGPGGMLEHLKKLPSKTRKILIHINNTNPILNENSDEYALCKAIGVEVAHDGMEIEL
jgi:pyrroloquinoline quinone biosynthesis protein B